MSLERAVRAKVSAYFYLKLGLNRILYQLRIFKKKISE